MEDMHQNDWLKKHFYSDAEEIEEVDGFYIVHQGCIDEVKQFLAVEELKITHRRTNHPSQWQGF